jgi:cell division protein FtsZ
MKFDLPKEQASIIKVIGVGGGGGNAVNFMYEQGIKDVDFVVCNTDAQQLAISPVPVKIQLGTSLTEGRGAGAIPEVGKNAAIENIDQIREILSKNTKMVFITAGMGGGTGTGAAPVIAKLAKDMGILTVGIVTIPFAFEGRRRKEQADRGLEEMRDSVDTLLVINNERLREMYGNLGINNAFTYADNVLATAARGIAEVISVTGIINIDFNDVNTVMRDSGVAIMGQAQAEGEDRARKAVESALASPLLNDNDITGAQYVLLNITYGAKEVLMDEISDITDYIQDEAGSTADVIWGHAYDEKLGDKLGITIIATGFQKKMESLKPEEVQRQVHILDPSQATPVSAPLESPVSATPSISETKVELKPEPEFQVIKAEETVVEAAIETVSEPSDEQTRGSVESSPSMSSSETSESKTSDSQFTFEFQVKSPFGSESSEAKETSDLSDVTASSETEIKRYTLESDTQMAASEDSNMSSELTKEEQESLNRERISRIKELASKLKTPSGLNELENEPAYKRRNVTLKDVPHSSESNVSRFTVSASEIEDEKPGLKQNNSFLHDNVD